MKKAWQIFLSRYFLLRERGQSFLSSAYLAFGWMNWGESFVASRLLREPEVIGSFFYTEWSLFWLFNSIQPLACESKLARNRFDKKPRWSKKY